MPCIPFFSLLGWHLSIFVYISTFFDIILTYHDISRHLSKCWRRHFRKCWLAVAWVLVIYSPLKNVLLFSLPGRIVIWNIKTGSEEQQKTRTVDRLLDDVNSISRLKMPLSVWSLHSCHDNHVHSINDNLLTRATHWIITSPRYSWQCHHFSNFAVAKLCQLIAMLAKKAVAV